uniref:Uncharacterized protein n=1 Tax=Arundo donax TaxID=35708 RepID=A0A0A9CZN6_ARUDO
MAGRSSRLLPPGRRGRACSTESTPSLALVPLAFSLEPTKVSELPLVALLGFSPVRRRVERKREKQKPLPPPVARNLRAAWNKIRRYESAMTSFLPLRSRISERSS